jgi:hypothetical protein
MATLIVLLILIVALIGYIVFLQIQLSKRNIFIESTVKRLSGIESSRSMDEMMAFLQEIQILSRYSSFFSNKLLDKDSLDFIFESEKTRKIYMHYTKDEDDANSILRNGFRFANSFYKTAVHVSRDQLDLKIKHNSRKFYGDFLIVISISNDIVGYYLKEMEKAGIKNYNFENILTEAPPSGNENSDLIYQLPCQYIKGYINYRTGRIVKNIRFDPFFNSPGFSKNINRLKII